MADRIRVVRALQETGLAVESVYDLVNSPRPYPQAIPVLLRLLGDVEDDRTKEGIVRALGVKEARGVAAPALIEEFKRIDPEQTGSRQDLKWAIGNALSVVMDETVFDDVAQLLRDKRHGDAREMLVLGVARLKDRRSEGLLMQLLDDDELAGHAIIALGRLKAKRARPRIEQYLQHTKPWIRREARKALERIDRASK